MREVIFLLHNLVHDSQVTNSGDQQPYHKCGESEKVMNNNEIINALKIKIKKQAEQIKQLESTNNELLAIINDMSAAEMPDDAVELETETPIAITREFIEFTVIRKIRNCIIPGVKNNVAVAELSMLIKDDEITEYELVDEFNKIIYRHVYQRMYNSTDSGLERAINLLTEIGYKKIETPKGSPAIGPYWERVIGNGVVDVLYRSPFRLAYNGSEYFLKGICSAC